jgi:sortase A
MRLKKLILVLAAVMVAAALTACSSGGGGTSDGLSQKQEAPKEQAQKEQAQKEQAQKEQAPDKKMTEEAKKKEVAPQQGSKVAADGKKVNKIEPPKDKTLKLTVPKMAEIKNDTIPTGRGTNDTLFRDYAGVHLKYTGFPWQETANVYIAGHRIGFPGTNSDMAFYDLEDLRKGDTFYLTDSEGRRYNYKVFKKLIVPPTDLSVLKRIEGKNIVSLQTCTLPDYTNRVVYQAELKDIKT